jgi:hypothetical protein
MWWYIVRCVVGMAETSNLCCISHTCVLIWVHVLGLLDVCGLDGFACAAGSTMRLLALSLLSCCTEHTLVQLTSNPTQL